MSRLNNKDFTVEQLERLIYLADVLVKDRMGLEKGVDPVCEQLKDLMIGSNFTNFKGEEQVVPIPWNFKFEMLINPETMETASTIRNAMRSSEVNENIKNRFNAIVREEVNWYLDRIKYFTVKGDTNILE